MLWGGHRRRARASISLRNFSLAQARCCCVCILRSAISVSSSAKGAIRLSSIMRGLAEFKVCAMCADAQIASIDGIVAVARPTIVGGCGDPTGAHRIQFDVLIAGKHVAIVAYQG